MNKIITGFLVIGIGSASAGITYLSESRSIYGEVLTESAVLVDGDFVDVFEDYSDGAAPLADFHVSDSLSGLFGFASSNQTSSLSSSGGNYRGGISALSSWAGSRFNVGFSVDSDTLLEMSGNIASYYDGGASISLMKGGDSSTIWQPNSSDWLYDSTSGRLSQDFEVTQELEAGETYLLSVSHWNEGNGRVESAINFTFSIPEPSTSLLVITSCCFLGIRRR